MHKKPALITAFLFLASFLVAAQSSPSEGPVDTNAMTAETQQIDQHNSKMGLFWWLPVEYWEQSAIETGTNPEEARKQFAPLREYTMFVVGVGDLRVGTIRWLPEDDVRGSVVLRDQSGNTYKPVDKVSVEAQAISDILKPVFKNILGPMAEGLHVVYFPTKDSAGHEFANPRRHAEFSLLVANLMGPATSTYTWRLPLTSMLPPKFCPVGKEKVNANWKYCPWHGNKLDADATPVPAPTPTPSKH
jgi:hypothetical protein